MNEQQEGPSIVVIPKQRYNSCVGCKWLDGRMIHSGHNPRYGYSCTHPVWNEDGSTWKRYNGKRTIETYMGYNVNTPGWCPVLSEDEGYQTTDKSEGGVN